MNVRGYGRIDRDRVRYIRGSVRKRVQESQRHAVLFIPDGKELRIPVEVVRPACLIFRIFHTRVLAPSEESQRAAQGSVSRFKLQPSAHFSPDVRGHDRVLHAVGVERDMDRFGNRRQIPQGVKHHVILPAVILQRIPGLIYRILCLRIRRPALEDQLSAFGQFRGQHGVCSLRNLLRFRRFGTAVGVIDDIPVVPCDSPLGPEGQVILQGDLRARVIGGSAAVLFGIPADELAPGKFRNRVRDLHIFGEEGHEDDILRPVHSLTGLGIPEIYMLLRNIQRKGQIIKMFHFMNRLRL